MSERPKFPSLPPAHLRFRSVLGLAGLSLFLLPTSSLPAAVTDEYVLTDITDWTPAQLAGLPHFDRYVPVAPAGATATFTAVCTNGLGLTAGNHRVQTSNVDDGAVVEGGTLTNIPPWGTYHWSYWIWDGHDNHHYWGSVDHSPVRAANVLGMIAGYANLGGSGSGVGSTSEYDDHAYLYDPATGEKTDLTPTAHRADPRDLNDRGEITGYWSEATVYHPFRRSADGTFTDLVFDESFSHSISPSLINNHGHVVGQVTVWTTPRDYIPFISESGSSTAALPYPDTANNYKASLADINDHDVIVGYYHKADTPLETTALRWTKQGGTWIAEELIELIDDNMDFILDRSIAVNDAGHIICSGHADGGPDDTWNTHRFLLTPVTFAPPAVTTLPPVGLGATIATLRAKINAGNLATTAMFQHGETTSYGTNTAIASSSGTLPVLAELPLTGLTPHTTYHFHATGSNAAGPGEGGDISFTTPWDWTSWSTATLGSSDPQGDANQNGLPDLIDYATGSGPAPTLALSPGGPARFTFRRSLVADGVTLVVQVSTDLDQWQDGSSYSFGTGSSTNTVTTELSRVADGPDAEFITVEAMAGDRIFMRLAAILP